MAWSGRSTWTGLGFEIDTNVRVHAFSFQLQALLLKHSIMCLCSFAL